MFAEITDVVPVQIGAWLACLAFMVMLLNGAGKLLDRWRGESPTPPNEQLSHQHTTLSRRVDGHASEIEQLRAQLRHAQEEQDRKDSTHRASLYRKIEESENKLRIEIKELRRENTEKMEDNRRELSEDIKNMPSQIIALLKNTKVI